MSLDRVPRGVTTVARRQQQRLNQRRSIGGAQNPEVLLESLPRNGRESVCCRHQLVRVTAAARLEVEDHREERVRHRDLSQYLVGAILPEGGFVEHDLKLCWKICPRRPSMRPRVVVQWPRQTGDQRE